EVGRLTVRSIDDAILVVTEVGAPEPDRPVLLVDVAVFKKALHRALDPPLLMKRPLRGPDVEMDAETFEACLDAAPDPGGSPAAQDGWRVRPRGRRLRPDLRRDGRREIVDVVAAVPVLRDGLTPLQRRDRSTQLGDQAAGGVAA